MTSLRAEINMKEPGTGDSQQPPEVTVVTHYDDQSSSSQDEITRLQDELQCLRNQYQDLSDEYQILQQSNKIMVHQLERMEALHYSELSPDRSRSKLDDALSLETDSEELVERYYFSSKRTSLVGTGSVCFKSVDVIGYGGNDYEEDNRMPMLMPILTEERSTSELQLQLENEEQKVEVVQAQCDSAQDTLREMESKYQVSREEWERLQEELRLCKEEIERLNGTIPVGGRVMPRRDRGPGLQEGRG
uniref:Uncharacterized protein n=1 Tax=Sphaerodactylus townsendi TaxID=933632 RepID=A0ACB8FM82_9SAUR